MNIRLNNTTFLSFFKENKKIYMEMEIDEKK